MITSYYISRHTATGIYYITLNTEDKWIDYMVNKFHYQGGLSVTFYKGKDDVTENIDIDGFNVFDYQLLSQQEKDQITIVCLPLKMIREFEKTDGKEENGQ